MDSGFALNARPGMTEVMDEPSGKSLRDFAFIEAQQAAESATGLTRRTADFDSTFNESSGVKTADEK
jgi:hypothetical protein